MEQGYKLRIYPNKTQIILLAKTFGCVRYTYNHFLGKRIALYEEEGKTLTFNQCSKELTSLKKELGWLKEPDKFALQNALKDLDKAYKNFFKKRAKFPKFKCKSNRYRSYRTNFTNNNIKTLGKKIKLPKLGFVKFKGYKKIKGRILNVTISQEPNGLYYISICCSDVERIKFPKTNKSIGLDLGIKEFCITSNGEKYENPKYLSKSLHKLAKLQKELSRKSKGGSNWNKARLKVAKLHKYITNQRLDYSHKLSCKLVRENDIICIETLKIKNMVKNHKLARSISDVSWFEFTRQLEYKSKWHNKKVIKIDTFYASTQTCSCCGYKNKDIKDLSIRKWICPSCGKEHDRDINAAKNILSEGLKKIS